MTFVCFMALSLIIVTAPLLIPDHEWGCPDDFGHQGGD